MVALKPVVWGILFSITVAFMRAALLARLVTSGILFSIFVAFVLTAAVVTNPVTLGIYLL